MKTGIVKRALAAALSAAMICSMPASVRPAAAAAKQPQLNTSFKTLRVGQKDYRLRLTGNTSGWKITKAAAVNKSIVAITGRKSSYCRSCNRVAYA